MCGLASASGCCTGAHNAVATRTPRVRAHRVTCIVELVVTAAKQRNRLAARTKPTGVVALGSGRGARVVEEVHRDYSEM